MSARWRNGLAVLALSIAGPLGAAPLDAPAVITRCAAQADAGLTGIQALSRACGGLDETLRQSGLTAFLPPGWQKTLTAGVLAQLGALLGRYGGTPASTPPEAGALRTIAARLVPPLPPPTWSDRLEAWLQHWTRPLRHRLGEWLRSLGPAAGHAWLARTLFFGLTALILVAFAALLTFELRGAGLLRRQPVERLRSRRGVAPSRTDSVGSQWREPDWTRLRDQPARVLRLLVDTLTRTHRLERDRHLTCRELEVAARFDTEAECASFVRVARLAERELYGPPGVAALPEETLRDAQMLHARLLSAAGRSGGVRS